MGNSRRRKSWFRLLLWLGVIFILLPLLGSLLFQLHFVQNLTVDRLAQNLSDKLHAKVEISDINFRIFKKLVLQDLYIEDQAGDTLLYSKEVVATFNTGLFQLAQKKLEINAISLKETQFNIRKDTNAYFTNLQRLLMELKEGTELKNIQQNQIDFELGLRRIDLENTRFLQEDAVKGNMLEIVVPQIVLTVEKIDLPAQKFIIDKLQLDRPSVKMTNTAYQDLPIDFADFIMPDSLLYPDPDLIPLLVVDKCQISDGTFELDNLRKPVEKNWPDSILNYNRLRVFDIDLDASELSYKNLTYSGRLEQLYFKDISGIELNNLSIDQIEVSSKQLALLGLSLETGNTVLGDTLIFNYENYNAFGDFNREVILDVNFTNTVIAFDDIVAFAPKLKQTPFFIKNKNRRFRLGGHIDGAIDNLEGDNLELSFNGGTRLSGNFNSMFLTDPDRKIINLALTNFNTNIRTLRRVIPNLSLPDNFDKLGQIRYQGELRLLFDDFIFGGQLSSNLGTASMDMQFVEISKGFANANYSGRLGLKNFDLGKWTDNSDLGKVTLSASKLKGKGLTSDNAKVEVEAAVKTFLFRDYEYNDAKFRGQLTQRLFNGSLELADDNVAFDFTGILDFNKAVPDFDFVMNVERLNFQPINLTKNPLSFSGKLDLDLELPDNDLTKSKGTATLNDITFSNDLYEESIDTILFTSNFDTLGNRAIKIESDMLKADFRGKFELSKLKDDFFNYLYSTYPTYSKRLKLPKPVDTLFKNDVRYELEIAQTGNLPRIFIPTVELVEEISVKGEFNSAIPALKLKATAGAIQVDSIQFQDIAVRSDFDHDDGEFNVSIEKTQLKNGSVLEPLSLFTLFYGDTIRPVLNYGKLEQGDFAYQLLLDSYIFPVDSTDFMAVLETSNLELFKAKWDLSRDNYIRLGENSIEVGNFKLTDRQGRVIGLENVGEKGLELRVKNFEFGIIDTLWDYDPLNFAGKFDLSANVADIFKSNNFAASLRSDRLLINQEDWGNLQVNVFTQNLKAPINANVELTKSGTRLKVNGYYNPKNLMVSTVTSPSISREADYMDIAIETYHFPMRFLKYFLVGVSRINGFVDADLSMKGKPNLPDFSGDFRVDSVGVTIDFLKTRYFIYDQKAKLTNTRLDATGGKIRDQYGNTATVTGGLTHNRLKNLGVDLVIKTDTDKFSALNTTKKDNEYFYGKALGAGQAKFSGSFLKTDISINARAGLGTKISIPVSSARDGSQVSFIKFSNQPKDTLKRFISDVKGVHLDLSMSLNKDAEVELIFDEQTGDILTGKGQGDISISLDRNGEMSMYGNYIVESGKYLFTLFNLVNKPFEVKRGGTIRWNGDPFNATINLQAKYADLTSPVADLIPEYLSVLSGATRDLAFQPTEVDMSMNLEGELFKPAITFDLNCPSVPGELKTFVDNKIRLLKQDQNELNKQVFGLIVFGSFLPTDFSLTGGSTGDIAINTLSELISNQLSILVSDFLGEITDDVKAISDIDLDFAYKSYRNEIDFSDESFYSSGQEFGIRPKASFWDDKVTITVGGSITNATNNNSTAKSFLGYDVAVDVVLNEDRNLKLKVYTVNDPNVISGNNVRSGVGITYRKEFNTFKELFQSLFQKKEEKD